MAELIPVSLPLLLRRAFLEYRGEGKIFDLPRAKFFHGLPGLDLSVSVHGHRASTPLGPAAGPHGQLAQNIALCWLGGARIIELKTVQILDELKIPRPCIDAANVGYNVEWSQELKLEQSLREYVGAAMFLQILKASELLGRDFPAGDTVFDMSVGYNLKGIQSPRVRAWLESMKNSGPVIDELREGLTGAFARYRDLPFSTCTSDTVSLSTFHGCPAGEIERIVSFLVADLGLHVCVKLNPTLLGYEETEHLLHGVLGYREIRLNRGSFDSDLKFAEALDLIPRLQAMARAHGRSLSVKIGNTLVVRNHKQFFTDELMYLSGPPLHVLALHLVRKFRRHMPAPVPVSFSGGLDAHNVANTLALNLIPVTTCTDLLRPGGYGRLSRYLENLGDRMTELGVTNIPDFVARHAGREDEIIDAATADPRYRWEHNNATPRKIGARLWLYDCINCDKCVPNCPNDANFIYEAPEAAIEYENFELAPGEIRGVPGGVLRVGKSHQIANYADVCNECGNCDVFCPEEGGPEHSKPRFFGSLETYRKYAGANGFYVDWTAPTIYGAIAGKRYALTLTDPARFETPTAEIEIRLSDGRPVAWQPKPGAPARQRLDVLPYLELKLLFESIANPRRVHFVNVAAIEEAAIGKQDCTV